MPTPKDVRGLDGAGYEAAKRELLAPAAPARPKPTTAADRPDIETVDVRNLPADEYLKRKAEFGNYWST